MGWPEPHCAGGAYEPPVSEEGRSSARALPDPGTASEMRCGSAVISSRRARGLPDRGPLRASRDGMACTPDPRSGREDPRREEITAQAELAEQTTTGGG